MLIYSEESPLEIEQGAPHNRSAQTTVDVDLPKQMAKSRLDGCLAITILRSRTRNRKNVGHKLTESGIVL